MVATPCAISGCIFFAGVSWRLLAHRAHHGGERRAEDVGIEQADAQAGFRGRDREVDRDGRLADAALGRGDGDDAACRPCHLCARCGACAVGPAARARVAMAPAGRRWLPPSERRSRQRPLRLAATAASADLRRGSSAGPAAGFQDEADLAVRPHDQTRNPAGSASPLPETGSFTASSAARTEVSRAEAIRPLRAGGAVAADQDFFAPVTRRTRIFQRPRST